MGNTRGAWQQMLQDVWGMIHLRLWSAANWKTTITADKQHLSCSLSAHSLSCSSSNNKCLQLVQMFFCGALTQTFLLWLRRNTCKGRSVISDAAAVIISPERDFLQNKLEFAYRSFQNTQALAFVLHVCAWRSVYQMVQWYKFFVLTTRSLYLKMTTNTANVLVNDCVYTIKYVDLMVNNLFFPEIQWRSRLTVLVYPMHGWLFLSFFTHISFKMGTITLAVVLLDVWYTVTFYNKAKMNSIIQLS